MQPKKPSLIAAPNLAYCLLLALLLLPTLALSAKVYKWVDKDGQIHFSQTPPTADSNEYSVQFAKEKSPPPPVDNPAKTDNATAPDPKAAATPAETIPQSPQEKLAAMEKARAEQAKKDQEAAALTAEKQENCKKAQANLRNAEKGGRVYDVDEKGERRYWDDTIRAQKKAEATSVIEKYCN